MLFQNNNFITNLIKEFDYDDKTSLFLYLLLITDCIFIVLHFVPLTPWFDNPLLNIDQDQGYAEIYMYIKELWIIILLAFFLVKTKSYGYGALMLLFVYILLDDSMQIHETVGAYLAERFELPAVLGLRSRDLGELIVSAVSASVLLGFILLFYLKGSADYKKVTTNIFLLLLALAFFGVFIDMVDMMIKIGWEVNFILAALEDGGELIVMSFMTYYLYVVQIRSNYE